MGEKVPIDKLIRIIVPRVGESGGGGGILYSGSNNQPGKGASRIPRRDEFLPRRKIKSDVYLNFYDFGSYTEDGGATWLDFDYEVKKQIITSFGGNVYNLEAMSISDWQILVDIVFDTPQDEWKNIFRKLDYEKAERFGIDVYLGSQETFEPEKYFPVARDGSRKNIKYSIRNTDVAGTTWTEAGLKVPKQTEPNFNLFSQNGFWNIHDLNFIKVTNEPNYLAEPVEFVIDKSCDFYLFPAHVIESGSYYAGDGYDWLNLLYTQLPRSLFVDDDDQWNATEWVRTPMVTRRINYFGPPTPRTDQIAQLMKDRYGARIYSSGDEAETPGSAGFPLSGDVYYRMTTVHGFTTTDTVSFLRVGSMMAAAKKGGEWFYFYADTDRSNNQPDALPATFAFSV